MKSPLHRSLVLLGVSLAALSVGSAHAGTGGINPGMAPQPPVVVDTNSADLLKEFITWVTTQSQGPGIYTVGFTLTSNQKNNTATVAQGTLQYVAPSKVAKANNPEWADAHLVGTGAQYFNTRLYAYPNCDDDPNVFDIPTLPFNPFATDKLGVSIDATTGRVKLTLLSQGGAIAAVDTVADPASDVIYGFGRGPAGTARAMYTITFSKVFQAILH